jgi:hypothetical protein
MKIFVYRRTIILLYKANINFMIYVFSATMTWKLAVRFPVEHNSFFYLHDPCIRQSSLGIRLLPASSLYSCHKADPDVTNMKAGRYCMQGIALPSAVSCRLISSRGLWQKPILMNEGRPQILYVLYRITFSYSAEISKVKRWFTFPRLEYTIWKNHISWTTVITKAERPNYTA